MNIVLAISEIESLVKTGGLADVGKALSVELAARDHQVSVFMPYYKALHGVEDLTIHQTISVEVPLVCQSKTYHYDIKLVEWKGAKLYLIDYPDYFNREGIYNDQYRAFDDNGERFSFFSGAVLHSILHLGIPTDIIHCHDWHTGVLPFLLKYNKASAFRNTRSILTIHNAAFQGVYSIEAIPFLQHHPDIKSQLHCNNINMLQTGLACADKITTVSPNYAQELLTPLGSHGLHEVLLSRKNDLSGILNGCDYAAWNPMSDPYLKANYSLQTIDKKAVCKQDLQQSFNVPQEPSVPILGMVCRLTEQKGFSYLLPIIPELLKQNVQLLIAGTGDPAVCEVLHSLAKKFPEQLSFFNGFSEEMAHKIEAGADFFLMPSQFEPCGLNQMYSLAYGTLPIVRAVGGLKDTVNDIHEDKSVATGVVFYEPSSDALLACVKRALLFYLDSPCEYALVQKQGMMSKFTWNDACNSYETLYTELHMHS